MKNLNTKPHEGEVFPLPLVNRRSNKRPLLRNVEPVNMTTYFIRERNEGRGEGEGKKNSIEKKDLSATDY